MSLNVTIFVCLLANLLFSYRGYEAKPTAVKSKSIADVIMNDTLIASSTRKIVERSKYLEECRKVGFPDKLVNLTVANLNQSLCLAIYDSYVRIGYHNNGGEEKKTENISLLNNETLFDEAIRVALEDTNPWKLCVDLANISSPVHNTTKPFVAQLKSKFAKHKTCMDMCVRESDDISPLCIVLGIIDQQLHAKVGDGNSKEKDVDKTGKYNSKNDLKSDTALDVGMKHTTTTTTTTTTIKIDVNVKKSPILETKAKNGRSEILSGIARSNVDSEITNTDEVGATNPNAKLDRPPMKNPVAETEENPRDNLDNIQQNDDSTNVGKSTTISEKTHEDQGDQSPEYDGIADNTPISDLDNGDSVDDIQSSITKQIQQLDVDSIDQKEKIPRLPSMRKEDDSHFFGYFTIIGLVGIGGCLIYHHKQKILAMIVEGRRSRGGRGRKRPSTANYRKLDCNLEEAVTSQCNSNVTHVIY